MQNLTLLIAAFLFHGLVTHCSVDGQHSAEAGVNQWPQSNLAEVQAKSLDSIDQLIHSDEGQIFKKGTTALESSSMPGPMLQSEMPMKSRKDRLAMQQNDDEDYSPVFASRAGTSTSHEQSQDVMPLLKDKLLREEQERHLEADKLFEAQEKLAKERQVVLEDAKALREARMTIAKEEAAVDDARKLEKLSRWQEKEAAQTLERAHHTEEREESSVDRATAALAAQRRERQLLTEAYKHTLQQKRADERRLARESEELQTARSRLESIARLERRQPREELEHNLEMKGGLVAAGFTFGILMACCWRRGKYDSQRLAKYT